MLIAYWILAGLLAVAYLGAGFMKTFRSKPALAAAGMAWTDDFQPASVKLIGIAELLGAIGLILPMLLNVAPILSPIAAALLTLVMIGAVVVHVRRKEAFAPALVLTVLSAVAAVLGFLVLAV